jgi:hypothetical protein
MIAKGDAEPLCASVVAAVKPSPVTLAMLTTSCGVPVSITSFSPTARLATEAVTKLAAGPAATVLVEVVSTVRVVSVPSQAISSAVRDKLLASETVFAKRM